MKIAIDVSAIIYGTGVCVYTKNLVESLLRIDKVNEYILFGGSLRRRGDLKAFLSTLKGGSTLQGKILPIPPTLADLIWNKIHTLPIERLVGKVDVFHSSDWTQPPSKAFKVTTIHDLVPLKFPQLSHPKIIATHKRRLYWVSQEVDRIIVPSQTTEYDAVKLGINVEKIRVIPEALDSIFKPAKATYVERLKRKYRIFGKYLLAIGVNPRKNTERVIKAYEKVKVGEELKLVIIGHQYMKIEVPRGVILVGHIPQQDLPIFYSGAEALVYPSLYEGFGLTILEAFVCKTPVVTSNFGSMAEVAGNAAILVDPYSIESIAEGIRKAISTRKILVQKGLKRVKNYTWEKAAKETIEVYNEVGV